MINQEFKAQETKYQVLPNFGVCCREQEGLKAMSFPTSVRMSAVPALSVDRHLLTDAITQHRESMFRN